MSRRSCSKFFPMLLKQESIINILHTLALMFLCCCLCPLSSPELWIIHSGQTSLTRLIKLPHTRLQTCVQRAVALHYLHTFVLPSFSHVWTHMLAFSKCSHALMQFVEFIRVSIFSPRSRPLLLLRLHCRAQLAPPLTRSWPMVRAQSKLLHCKRWRIVFITCFLKIIINVWKLKHSGLRETVLVYNCAHHIIVYIKGVCYARTNLRCTRLYSKNVLVM